MKNGLVKFSDRYGKELMCSGISGKYSVRTDRSEHTV